MDHEHPMRTALSLARRNLGQTWPNPSVGAVIIKNGDIIAEAATARGGRPHAETQAIEQAGTHTHGATLYVTLEPCSHYGQTPPCADAIIHAGFSTVVIACGDPNPKVAGQGVAKLKAAGINVIEDVCRQEAQELNRGFFSAITRSRPLVSLKIATSLDGKIATAHGQSKWITGNAAREYAHHLRSQYDAVATGIGTVLADDPELTCRLPGLEDRSPVRIVFDSRLRLPAESKLARSAGQVPVWALHDRAQANPALAKTGVRLLACGDTPRIDIAQAIEVLAKQGITRLLVEAGAELSTAFLQSGLVDRMYWFRAPIVIGNDGLAAFAGGLTESLDTARRWQTIDHVTLTSDSSASDSLEILECSPVS